MTVTLEYNNQQKGAKSLLQGILDSGFFKKVKTPTKKENPFYDPEFVKSLEKIRKEANVRFTPELQKEMFG